MLSPAAPGDRHCALDPPGSGDQARRNFLYGIRQTLYLVLIKFVCWPISNALTVVPPFHGSSLFGG